MGVFSRVNKAGPAKGGEVFSARVSSSSGCDSGFGKSEGGAHHLVQH